MIIAGIILEYVAFPVDASQGSVDPASISGLGSLFAISIAALYALSIAALTRYRISQSRHEETISTTENTAE